MATSNAIASPGNEAQPQPEHNPYVIALVVTMATFMEVLDTSIANVSLPHIAGNLSATVDESTWILTSYLVSNAIVLPLNGWFSSILGRKRYYMLCVALFSVSSLLCGLAPNLTLLIFFRVLQGVGGGGLQPSEQAILYDTFPAHKRGMGMAVYGFAVVTAPIIGPTLGGWITDNISWRWIFFINVPVGIVSLFLTSRLIHDPPFRKRKGMAGFKPDYIGLSLIALGLGALQIVLDRGQQDDWFGSRMITILAITSGLALLATVWWSLRNKDPLVDLHLLGERNFFLANVSMFLLGFVLFASTVLMPIFLQELMGYTATDAGLVLSPGGIVTMLAMPAVGILVTRLQARWLVVFGSLATSYGLYLMSGFNLSVDFRTAALSRMTLGLGIAFLFVPINTIAFYFIPRDKANNATGLLNLARNLGGSAGIALVTTLLQRQAQAHQQNLIGHLTPYNHSYVAWLAGLKNHLLAQGSTAVDAFHKAQGVAYNFVQQQAMALAFVNCFRLLSYLFLIIVPLMFLLKKTRPLKDHAPMH
jgi:DHA2 family multidrug resistance protein